MARPSRMEKNPRSPIERSKKRKCLFIECLLAKCKIWFSARLPDSLGFHCSIYIIRSYFSHPRTSGGHVLWVCMAQQTSKRHLLHVTHFSTLPPTAQWDSTFFTSIHTPKSHVHWLIDGWAIYCFSHRLLFPLSSFAVVVGRLSLASCMVHIHSTQITFIEQIESGPCIRAQEWWADENILDFGRLGSRAHMLVSDTEHANNNIPGRNGWWWCWWRPTKGENALQKQFIYVDAVAVGGVVGVSVSISTYA